VHPGRGIQVFYTKLNEFNSILETLPKFYFEESLKETRADEIKDNIKDCPNPGGILCKEGYCKERGGPYVCQRKKHKFLMTYTVLLIL
jgi:hypothetical protein